MDRDQLIDLTRRAVKLARDKTTDLTPTECTVAADTYTSAERLVPEKAMLMASPQLVGYASELPRPGTYCTKTVMGRSILLTRSGDDTCARSTTSACIASRRSPRAAGRPQARVSLPFVDLRPGWQSGWRARQGRLPRNSFRPLETDRATRRRVCRFLMDFTGPRRDPGHPCLPRTAHRRVGLLGYRAMGAVGREGAGLSDQLETRHRHVRRELPLRDGAQEHLRDHRAQQLHCFRFVRPAPPTCLSPQRNSRSRERS